MNLEPRTSNVLASNFERGTSHVEHGTGRRPILVFVMLALLVGMAYGNSLRNGFVYDDTILVVKNGLITRLDTLPKLLTSDYWITRRDPYGEPPPPRASGLYRPLVSLTFALNYAGGGLDPVGYHVVNVLLHLAVTWLVYLLARQLRLETEAALVAAALFAVHPLHTEAVTNVAGRSELLMSLGVLASLWFAGTGRRWWSLAAFGLSLFSKEQAALLPVLVLLYDLCLVPGTSHLAPRTSHVERRTSNLEHRIPLSCALLAWIARYGAYLSVLAGYLLVRWVTLGGLVVPPTPLIDNPLGALEGVTRLLSTLKVDGLYVQLFFWPASLSVDYSYDAIPAAGSMFELPVLFGFLAWGTLTAGMIWSFLYGARRVAFGLTLTILMFFPVSNVVVLIGTIMGERLFYLPSAGLCLLAGLAYERALSRNDVRRSMFDVSGTDRDRILNVERRTSNVQPRTSNLEPRTVLRLLVVVICLALAARTIVRNLDWVSDETVFQSAMQVVPQSAKVYHQMGTFALNNRKWAEANASFRTALQILPEYSLTESDLLAKMGVALLGEGDVEQAIGALERAVALERDSRSAHYHLGLAYAQGGRYEDAERSYRRALALTSQGAETYNSLSYVLTKQRRFREAEEMAFEALRLRSDFPEAHYNRGRALEGLGRIDEAIAEYERVLTLAPTEERLRDRLNRLRAK